MGYAGLSLITLPLLQPVIVLALLFRSWILKLFDIICALTGEPGSMTNDFCMFT
jgi:ABC-type sugar transport system permease subunit